jgi:hypothetical protein
MMTKREAEEHAKRIVMTMLSGRCSPEMDDVEDIEGQREKEMVIQAIEKVLGRLRESLEDDPWTTLRRTHG